MKETSNDVYQCIKKSSTSRLFIELRICICRIFIIKKKKKKKEMNGCSEILIPNVPFFEGGQQRDSKITDCSSMITKLTLASYCIPPEKTHISSQTASKM